MHPDYDGGSIVNLMASLRLAFGAPPGEYPPLRLLPPEEVTGQHVVLLIADGVGHDRCQDLSGSVLRRHLRGAITSVFPTTTATAVTSFYTGVAPQQHGMTGWFTWFRELGSVAMVLPFMPRRGGLSYTAQGVDPTELFARPSLFTQVPGRVINPAHIADSPYSRACGGPAERRAYHRLEELFSTLGEGLAGPPRLHLAYWSDYDGACHRLGMHADETQALLQRFDSLLGEFIASVAGRNVTVIVTADHGMVNTRPESVVDLKDHPELQADLTLPLCGEPRTAFCYVHAPRREHFLAYVSEHLGHCCQVVPSQKLLAEGWFGLGSPHPELRHRVGDYTLLMGDHYVITERLPGERPFSQVGAHGGISAAELLVPLVVAKG